MISRHPIPTRTATRFPYTTLFRSRIGAGAFDAVVPTEILAMTVTVMLAIGLVAAMFIGGQVRQREAVMRRQEIDGPRRRSAMENVGRSREPGRQRADHRSEEHKSELQSLMRISYAVFCLKKK